MTPSDLKQHIERLPEQDTYGDRLPGASNKTRWYRSQKEHWLGWLAYNDPRRDARFVYNHIACPMMLIWLAEAIGLGDETVERAFQAACDDGPQFGRQCGAIRRVVPWDVVAERLSSSM